MSEINLLTQGWSPNGILISQKSKGITRYFLSTLDAQFSEIFLPGLLIGESVTSAWFSSEELIAICGNDAFEERVVRWQKHNDAWNVARANWQQEISCELNGRTDLFGIENGYIICDQILERLLIGSDWKMTSEKWLDVGSFVHGGSPQNFLTVVGNDIFSLSVTEAGLNRLKIGEIGKDFGAHDIASAVLIDDRVIVFLNDASLRIRATAPDLPWNKVEPAWTEYVINDLRQ